jgi:hypothetical protein
MSESQLKKSTLSTDQAVINSNIVNNILVNKTSAYQSKSFFDELGMNGLPEQTNVDVIPNINHTIESNDHEQPIQTEQSVAWRIPITVVKITGNAMYYMTTTHIGRKALFAGILYFTGGTVVSMVGLTPITIAGALAMIL